MRSREQTSHGASWAVDPSHHTKWPRESPTEPTQQILDTIKSSNKIGNNSKPDLTLLMLKDKNSAERAFIQSQGDAYEPDTRYHRLVNHPSNDGYLYYLGEDEGLNGSGHRAP